MYKVEYSYEQTQSHENLAVGGEQFPHKVEVNKNMHRIYSHPLCPYAEKARLAFRAKGIKHQIVNIDQRGKPDWFTEQGGAVPVLETPDGVLIPESDVIVDYAMAYTDDGVQLLPKDPVKRAKLQLYLKQRNENLMLPMYMAALSGKEEDITKLKQKLDLIEQDLSKNDEGNKYLANQDDISLVDIHIAPALHRVFILLDYNLPNYSSIDKNSYPHIQGYLETIRNREDLAPAFG